MKDSMQNGPSSATTTTSCELKVVERKSGVYRDGCPERLNLHKAGRGMMRMGQTSAAVN
jgi:hypothetical protein